MAGSIRRVVTGHDKDGRAIVVMLKAPKGLWGLIADRYGWRLFPLERRLVIEPVRIPDRS